MTSPLHRSRQAGAHDDDDVTCGREARIPVSTLLILGALGALAWLLAGGWPYVRDAYVPDDGPVGLGAGVTATCPACALGGVAARPGRSSARQRIAAAVAPVAGVASHRAEVPAGGVGLRPSAVGRDHSLRLECPGCGTTYTVLTAARGVPTPRSPLD